ncbi:MAG: hypothetical protein MJZ92_01115 [Paludibacteraceae bacterium]|nr:hypothetical protein [Paludibacteraceae bacterium]
MGEDFRRVEGVDAHFRLESFSAPDFDCKVQRRAGCYIISSPTHAFEYPNGKSPVIYIGLSDDLFRRLHDEHYQKHLKLLIEDKDWGLGTRLIHMMPDKYQYMRKWGARVDVFYNKGTQSEKEFESSLIANFYSKYRAMPVGNGARSYSQK